MIHKNCAQMPCCSAKNCTNRSETKGVRMFRFPSNLERRRKWVENMRCPNWEPTTGARLCNVHFENSQYEQNRADGWRKLKPNAVPTLFYVSNPPPAISPPPCRSLHKIKEEPTGLAEKDIWNSTEGGKPYSLKNKVKKEDFEEEELPRPETVIITHEIVEEADPFPFEISDPLSDPLSLEHRFEPPCEPIKDELEADSEDHLSMCNEDILTIKGWSVAGGECDPEGSFNWKTRLGSDVQKLDGVGNEDTDRTIITVEIEPKSGAKRNKNLAENASQVLKSISATHADERCFENSSESKGGGRITQQEARHECSLCQKIFTRRAYLIKHVQIHCGERPYECFVCGKSFLRRYYLVSHMRVHSDKRPYKCSVCEKRFTWRNDLNSHTRIHSGERPYECSVCEKSFSRSDHLVNHLRIHSGERPYECSVCEKRFTTSCQLNSHIRIHSTERSYECSVCEKSFTHRSGLVQHMRFHSGERPYECSVCEKRFSRRGNLITHFRIHSGERPYECSVCEKSYTQRSGLVQHMRLHSGERPYGCSVCEKRFSRKGNLMSHIRIHSRERPRSSPSSRTAAHGEI